MAENTITLTLSNIGRDQAIEKLYQSILEFIGIYLTLTMIEHVQELLGKKHARKRTTTRKRTFSKKDKITERLKRIFSKTRSSLTYRPKTAKTCAKRRMKWNRSTKRCNK